MTFLHRSTFFASILTLVASSNVGCVSHVENAVTKTVATPVIAETNKRVGNYTGEWTGVWMTPDGAEHPMRATLVQDGLSVHGTMVLEDNPCFPELDVTAQLTERGLQANLRGGGMDLHYTIDYFDGTKLRGELSLVRPALCTMIEGGSAVVQLIRLS